MAPLGYSPVGPGSISLGGDAGRRGRKQAVPQLIEGAHERDLIIGSNRALRVGAKIGGVDEIEYEQAMPIDAAGEDLGCGFGSRTNIGGTCQRPQGSCLTQFDAIAGGGEIVARVAGLLSRWGDDCDTRAE